MIAYWQMNLSVLYPPRTVVRKNVVNFFHAIKLSPCVKRCGFRMRSANKLEVHRNVHIDTHGHKVVTFENMEVCCTAWYTIHAVSKVDFYRFRMYSSVGRRSRFHGNSGTKKPRKTTLQGSATLSTIIVSLGRCNVPQNEDIVFRGENCTNGVAHGHKMEKHINGH
jgi:hypothetical protein